jgi:hypothetical protein
MIDDSKPTTRRNVLIGASLLTGLSLLAQPKQAEAAGTMPPSNVKYQTHPNAAGQHCAKCNYFLPGASPTAPGKCKIVAGAISPNGWCTMFAAKRA